MCLPILILHTEGQPTKVGVELFISSIYSINDAKMVRTPQTILKSPGFSPDFDLEGRSPTNETEFLPFQEYSMTFWLRTWFHDCELAFEGFNHEFEWVTLNNEDTRRFWVPDIYFRAERASVKHDVPAPNVFMRLYKNGTVVVSQK